MKKTLSIVLLVLLVFLAVACNPQAETHTEHTFNEGYELLAPTCSSTGTWRRVCTVCGYIDDQPIAKVEHAHEDGATPLSIIRDANCLVEGSAVYLCKYCKQSYNDTIAKNYKNHAYFDADFVNEDGSKGKYCKVTADDGNYYSWSTEAKAEKTVFTTASLVAYCKGCKQEISYITKPVADGKSKDSDFADYYGLWTWTAVSTNSNTKGNSLTVRLLITKDSATKLDKVEGYLSAYNAATGATTTETYSQAVTWTNGEGTRTAEVTLANGTKTTSFTVYDGDGNNDVELLGGAKLTLSESDGKLVAKHSVLNGGTEDDAEVETAISFDNEHQEHDMSVMTLFGVPYITKGTKTYSLPNDETGNFKIHYTECLGCGLAYLPEEHTAENEAGTKDSNKKFTATKTCSVCGYDPSFDTTATTGYGSKYVVATVDNEETYVPVNTVLVVPFTDYTPFNKKSIKIVGWNSDEGIVWNGNGYLVSANGTLDAVEV